MNFSSGDLIKYQEHRLYIIDIVKHRFKEYIVCIDFTDTLEKNDNCVYIVILFQTKPDIYTHLEDERLSYIILEKNNSQLQANSEDVTKMLLHSSGLTSDLPENERAIIRKYLEETIENKGLLSILDHLNL